MAVKVRIAKVRFRGKKANGQSVPGIKVQGPWPATGFDFYRFSASHLTPFCTFCDTRAMSDRFNI
jgi:hypothetical protein